MERVSNSKKKKKFIVGLILLKQICDGSFLSHFQSVTKAVHWPNHQPHPSPHLRVNLLHWPPPWSPGLHSLPHPVQRLVACSFPRHLPSHPQTVYLPQKIKNACFGLLFNLCRLMPFLPSHHLILRQTLCPIRLVFLLPSPRCALCHLYLCSCYRTSTQNAYFSSITTFIRLLWIFPTPGTSPCASCHWAHTTLHCPRTTLFYLPNWMVTSPGSALLWN